MRTVTGVPHNLPAVPSSFLGRDRDVAGVADLLAEARLVTITGPAGMGKTRLAVETATRVAEGYPDGAWLVELAALREDAGVAAAVASTLSLAKEVGRPTPETLAAALRERKMLIVLDNCEHLVQACAQLAAALVTTCRGVSLLATSQEPLTTAGERVWDIEPLSLPPPDVTDDLEILGASEAVRLFCDRARAQKRTFSLPADTAAPVAEICRCLDGMPLAIELAAARVGVLPVEAIAHRLDDRFRLLTGGSRTVLPRHQTLRAALDWSHDLLPAPQRLLFRRLAVFVGGWSLPAATAVCSGEGVDEDAVLDLVADLRRRSLVADQAGPEPRYRLLDTARQYARERLDEAGEDAALHARHAHWYVALADRAEPELAAGDQRAWLARLEADRDNLHAALSHLLAGGQVESAARLSGALVLFWTMRGRYHEGMDWLERVIAAGGGTPRGRATVLWGGGLLARALGDYPAARSHATDSLALARTLGDACLTARALGLLGALGVSTRQQPTTAMAQLAESVTLAREAGDTWCEIGALVPLGLGHMLAGEHAAARTRFEECLAVAEQAGNEASEAHRLHALSGLGRAELAEGDHRAATALFEQALELARTLGIPSAAASALRFLGEAARLRGDYATAARLLTESLEGDQALGAAVSSASGLALLGRLALARDDAAEAGRLLRQALALAAAEGLPLEGPRMLADLGAAQRLTGDLHGARARLEEALSAARDARDEVAVARALQELGRLARTGEDYPRAASLHHEALALYDDAGDRLGVIGSLEALAGLAALAGRARDAARLFGAAQAMRDAGALPRPPVDQPEYDADVDRVRQALDADDVAALWAAGAALTPERAVAQASRGRGRRAKAGDTGWGALSDRERDVALLAAEGLTNPEIAERLVLSSRTVQSHLAKVYAKLGVHSRREVAAQVRDRQWAIE
ncbi:MAG: helix-turn-helix transcriptional regulator [Egibacteraceae bacterium]